MKVPVAVNGWERTLHRGLALVTDTTGTSGRTRCMPSGGEGEDMHLACEPGWA